MYCNVHVHSVTAVFKDRLNSRGGGATAALVINPMTHGTIYNLKVSEEIFSLFVCLFVCLFVLKDMSVCFYTLFQCQFFLYLITCKLKVFCQC